MHPNSSLTKKPISKLNSEASLTEGKPSTMTPVSSLIETSASTIGAEINDSESVTDNKIKKKRGRPQKLDSSTAVTWSIRGVERETRSFLEKAAARAGKTLGQYLNDDVRGFAQGQLTQAEATKQAVASPRDLQVQVEQITRMLETIAARLSEQERKGFWQRVFGK